jgi:general secretion pathway protein I
MTGGRAGGRDQRGFTLLEVMVAVAILALFLVPLLGSTIGGLTLIRSAENRETALRLCQDKMSEIEMTALPEEEGTRSGDFGRDYDGYKWKMEMVRSPDLQFVEENFGVKAREVYLTVTWEEGGGEKSVSLATIIFLDQI